MPQERCVPHAIAWRGHNPFQALPEYLIQSYPSLNAHTVGYGPFWGNGIPEHILANRSNLLKLWDKTDTCEVRASGAHGPKNIAITRILTHVLPRSRTHFSDRTALV